MITGRDRCEHTRMWGRYDPFTRHPGHPLRAFAYLEATTRNSLSSPKRDNREHVAKMEFHRPPDASNDRTAKAKMNFPSSTHELTVEPNGLNVLDAYRIHTRITHSEYTSPRGPAYKP